MSNPIDTRFWISIFAPAIVLPAAAIATFTFWFIRLDLPPSADAALKPAILAVSHPIARAQVEASVVPPSKPIAEPAAPPPTARTLDALSTLPVPGDARPVYADPRPDTSTSESAGTYLEPATGSLSPQPTPQTAGVAETATPQPDAKVSDRVSVSSVIATPEVAPPIIPTELAAPESSRLIDGPIPLPKLRPHITIAYGNRTLPLPRPRPVENSSP